MGNGLHIVDNRFYDNGVGIVVDSFFAGGHPGFPQDSSVFEDNEIYSNNFNIYAEGSDVEPTLLIPFGTGVLIAGGNHNQVRDNHIWDNWRRGGMLMAVPDVVSCAPNPDKGSAPCTPQAVSTTSQHNRWSSNVMGRTPSGDAKPNGVDFWWDEFAGNAGNCWYPNAGSDGKADSVTSDPPAPPAAGASIPGFLPQDCDAPQNVGAGDAAKEAMLASCAGQIAADAPTPCEWAEAPEKPGTAAAARQRAVWQQRGAQLALARTTAPRFCGLAVTSLSCDPYRHRLNGRAAAPTTRALAGGVRLQRATCRDWRSFSARDRGEVLSTLESVVGVGGATTLAAGDAARIIDRSCGRTFARSFLLYEIYIRAAAFSRR
jgi:hypothetical protein